MNSDIEKAITACETCRSMPYHQQKEPLMSYPVPNQPCATVRTDLFEWHNCMYLITVDLYSGDTVRMQMPKGYGKPATITRLANEPRSYYVRSEEGTEYRRNRRHLLKVPTTVPATVDTTLPAISGETIETLPRNEQSNTVLKPIMSRSDKIPVVSVLMGGGHGTIKIVHDAIKCGTPVVIIEGSGHAADILARAYKKSMEESDDGSLQEYVKGMLKKAFPVEESEESAVKLVMNCLQKKDHMNVLQLDSVKEIDELILQALLKVNKNSAIDTMMQLKLALAWNCIDAAKNLLENMEKNMEDEQVNKIYFS
ncbi:Transient receptor potential cation channel subfamily M member 6 [Lamellibrachia satsuma]|nr:Transient receptor potential cation channel subfamily M member 6 [Lamellibrachia satsuma]